MKKDRDDLELPSYIFADDHRITKDFHQFFKLNVLPYLKLRGYKLASKRKLALLMVENLITYHLAKRACVSDTRDSTKAGAKFRAHVWDALVAAGFARVWSRGSELSGRVTRYRPTRKLLDLKSEWRLRLLVDIRLARNTQLQMPTQYALVHVHTGKLDLCTGDLLPESLQKQPIPLREEIERTCQRDADGKPIPRAIENGLGWFRAVEDLLDRINRSNLSFSWQAFITDADGKERVFQPNPCLRQIHVGKLFRAVRLYSWGALSGQNLSKDVRRSMLIDGEPVTEFDFSGMHPRLAYVSANVEAPRDVYQPERIMPKFYAMVNASEGKRSIVRGYIKQVTNVCLNVKRRSAANSVAAKLVKEPKSSIPESSSERARRKFLRNVIYNVEEARPAVIVDRVVEAHPALANQFFMERGLDLMTLDGKIMLGILTAFADAEKPALGIHDSVVCRVADTAFAQEKMAEIYEKFTHSKPVIRCVY